MSRLLLLASASPSPSGAGNPAEGGWGGPITALVIGVAVCLGLAYLARKRASE